MTRRSRIVVAGCATSALALTACAGTNSAEADTESITLRWTTPVAERSLQGSQDVVNWAKAVEERTDGRVKVKIYYGDSLVTVDETIDALQNGVADAATFQASVSPELFPSWVEFGTVHDLERTIDWTPAQQVEVTRQMRSEFSNLEGEVEAAGQKLLWVHPTPPYPITSSKRISELGDLKGTRIRTFGTGIPQMFAAAGASPTDLPYGEIYSATQTGTVDGAFTAIDGLESLSYYEVAPYVTTLGELGSTSLMSFGLLAMIRQDTWAKISEADQEVLLEEGRNAEEWYATRTLENMRDILEKWVDEGGEVTRLSDSDLAKWRQAYSDPYAPAVERLNEAGLPGDEMYERLIEIADEVAGE